MRLWDNAAALRRLYRWLYVCVVVCLLGAVGAWAVNSPYFPIKRVELATPLQRVAPAQVQAVVQARLQGNIFRADVNAARMALLELPWVAQARVTRIWPDAVRIELVEYTPVARWQYGGLVSQDGVLFEADGGGGLPLLVPEQDQADAAVAMAQALSRFQAALQPLGLKIVQLDYSARQAWTLTLDNGLKLRLGREQADERLVRFVRAWHAVIAAQATKLEYVDLRYKDGFAVRPKEDVAASAAAE